MVRAQPVRIDEHVVIDPEDVVAVRLSDRPVARVREPDACLDDDAAAAARPQAGDERSRCRVPEPLSTTSTSHCSGGGIEIAASERSVRSSARARFRVQMATVTSTKAPLSRAAA